MQLQQVVLNLLMNAFDAMKEAPSTERKVIVRAKVNGAGIVEISVRDHGIGLTSDKLAKIFHPFYTTKREASAWDSPSVDRLSKPMGAAFGRRTTRPRLDILFHHPGNEG